MTPAEFAKAREPLIFEGFEVAQIAEFMSASENLATVWTRGIRDYLLPDAYDLLFANLSLHFYICSGFENGDLTEPQNALFSKYGVGNAGLLVNSVSNSSSSASIQDFSSLSNAKFMLQDFYRTPYGQAAYTILETLQGVAIVV